MPDPADKVSTPYKVDTEPVALDIYAEYGGKHGCWYRIPSWRVHFDYEPLRDVDMRLHRSIASTAVWTLTEATTGFKVFGDLAHEFYVGDEGSMLAEFCAGMMLRITSEKMADAKVKASIRLTEKPPCPFSAPSVDERQRAIEEAINRLGLQYVDAEQFGSDADAYNAAVGYCIGALRVMQDECRALSSAPKAG